MDPSNVHISQLQTECVRLNEEKEALKKQHAATETAKLGLEIQNAALIGKLEKINLAVQKLVEERDGYRRHIRVIYEADEKSRRHHERELNDKDQIIQSLRTQLADSKKESAKKEEELQELHALESSDKSQLIYNLNRRVCLEEQQYTEKITVLQKEHVKQIEGMNLELQMLKTQQEQHAKELSDKDLIIQDLATRISGAEQQTVDKNMELTNELKKKNAVVNIELGKLYMDLQEAKKSQEALKARLDAKNKGIEYLTKQHEEKLAAKDSEIQILTKMVQDLQGSKLTNPKGMNPNSESGNSDDDWIFRKHFGRADYHKLLGMSP
ncbi:hypothetical protein GCK72_015887 [Caenorhabditis remanei]|uniref:Uncharacterized protein n=1 Tax=Caenorhabditis remanei TaxID=31234 RepID=A0A6A5GVA1_CAERE|nr:hypothetical protein GCK72_015887 [Caenorhabditis remanei]KAF1759420.1 hypothetical protein GCK72_015887 [Caenorhabditis remanei]